MHERMQMRLMGVFVVVALIFLALAARLVYLGGSGVERMAASNGVEVEEFLQYPPLVRAGAPVRPKQVRVPSLVGRSFSQAGESLVGTGLLIEGKGNIRGKVVRQEPLAGQKAPEGTAVRVWLGR